MFLAASNPTCRAFGSSWATMNPGLIVAMATIIVKVWDRGEL